MRTAKTDQIVRMPRLIYFLWAHRSFCWFCHAVAHFIFTKLVNNMERIGASMHSM